MDHEETNRERPTYIADRIVFQAKLKEEQAKPKPNGGSGQNTTTRNSGGSTSNNNVNPKVKPKCTTEDIVKNVDMILDIISKYTDWAELWETTSAAFSTGFKTNCVSNLIKSVRGGTVREKLISTSGAQKAVKNLIGYSTGPNTKVSTMTSKGLEKLSNKKAIYGIFNKIMKGLKIDVVKNVI